MGEKIEGICPFCKTKFEIDLAEETIDSMVKDLDEEDPVITIDVHLGTAGASSKWFLLSNLKQLKTLIERVVGKTRIKWDITEARYHKYSENGIVGEPGVGSLEGDGTKVNFCLC